MISFIRNQREKWGELFVVIVAMLVLLLAVLALQLTIFLSELAARPAFHYGDAATVSAELCAGESLRVGYTVDSLGLVNYTDIQQYVHDGRGIQVVDFEPINRSGAESTGPFSVRITTTVPLPALGPGAYAYGRIARSDVVLDDRTGESARVVTAASVPFQVVECD